jgi:hypothetical protein
VGERFAGPSPWYGTVFVSLASAGRSTDFSRCVTTSLSLSKLKERITGAGTLKPTPLHANRSFNLDKIRDAPFLVGNPINPPKERPMEEQLLEEILKQLRITNHLLATLLVEHGKPLKQQGYAFDEMPVKESDIMSKLRASAEAIDNS